MLVVGVPLMAGLTLQSAKMRGWLFAALVFSTALGDMVSINFVSLEHYRGPDRGFEVTLTDLLVLALTAVLLLRYAGKVTWLPYNAWPMAAFLVLALVSTWGAPRRLLAAFTLAKMMRAYLLFWCVLNCLKTGVSLIWLRRGLVAIGLFVLALVLKQKYMMGLYRVPGPFDHSNTVPLFLNMICPVVFIWALCDKRLKVRQVCLMGVATLGMVFSVLATQSRAGLVLSGGCVVVALLVANRRAKSIRTKAASVIVLGLLAVGVVMASDTIIRRFTSAPESSEKARAEFNVAADKMAGDKTFGVGLNNFSHVLTVNAGYREHFRVMQYEEQAGVVHHLYRLIAAEMGYPGLVVFVLILARFVWLGLAGAWKRKTLEGSLLFGFAAGALALHASGMLEWAFRVTPVMYLYVICAAATVAIAQGATVGPSKLTTPAKRRRPRRQC